MDFVFFRQATGLQEVIDFFFQCDHLLFTANGQPPEAGQLIKFGFQFPFGFLQAAEIHQPGKHAGLAFVFSPDECCQGVPDLPVAAVGL